MICKNCNAEIVDSAAFCTSCGTPVEKAQPAYQPIYQQPEQPVYQQPVYQQPEQPAYQQPVYQQPEQPVYQQPVYQQPQAVIQNNNVIQQEETAPITKISSYIGWSLVPYIPIVGFILMIVFAVDGKNKNRANYFRAMFLVALIVILISILPIILIGPALMSELQYMM